jgi:hypothetical protein
MFANIDHLQEVRIQAGLTNRPLKVRLIGPVAAPGHYYPVQLKLADCLLDPSLPFRKATVANLSCMNNIRQAGHVANERAGVDYTVNAGMTITNVNAYTRRLA